jgi:hypothetical protein
MAPGEVREISTGSSLVAQATFAAGQQLTNTIALPPVFVAADHIISIAPASQSSERGASATYLVTLTNPLATAETYALGTDGLSGFTVNFPSAIDVAPGQSVTVRLTVDVPLGEAPGTRGFTVSAHTLEGGTDSVEGALTVVRGVVLPSHAVDVSSSPTQRTSGPGVPGSSSASGGEVGGTSRTLAAAALAPTVTGVVRYGFHMQPTILVVSFSGALDPALAQDVNDYAIVPEGGRIRARNAAPIPVSRALYNPAAETVTLYPSRRLDVHKRYVLTVGGTAPGGLTKLPGGFRNGAGVSQSGTSFQTVIGRSTLAGTAAKALASVTSGWGGLAQVAQGVSAKAVDALAVTNHLSTLARRPRHFRRVRQ